MATELTPTEHRDLLLDLFTRITEDAAQLGLSPVGVQVRSYEVAVQIGGQDAASVDLLADAYGLRPNNPEIAPSLYDRHGRVEVAGHPVMLDVYCGRGVTA